MDSRLEALFEEASAWLRVSGRATYASATALRSFIDEALARKIP